MIFLKRVGRRWRRGCGPRLVYSVTLSWINDNSIPISVIDLARIHVSSDEGSSTHFASSGAKFCHPMFPRFWATLGCGSHEVAHAMESFSIYNSFSRRST